MKDNEKIKREVSDEEYDEILSQPRKFYPSSIPPPFIKNNKTFFQLLTRGPELKKNLNVFLNPQDGL